MTKRSRLAEEKSPVQLSIQNGRQSHLEAGHKKRPRDGHLKAGPSGFRWGTVFSVYLTIKCLKNEPYLEPQEVILHCSI
jgi:hypothetical protein